MGLVVLAVALGFAAARSPNVAVLMIGVVLTPLAARARPPGLVLLAFGAAWIGPTTTAWLEFPRVFDFASIPLIALAFTVALYEYRRVPRPSTSISSAVAWLPFMAFALSALIHGTHPTRYVASTVLYLLPFLAIVALTRVELSVRQRRTVITTVTLVLIGQVPFALVQAAQSSNADDVKGTLLGTGAGHHVLGSVALVGSLALPALWRTPNPVLLGSVFVGFFIAWLSDSLIPLFIVPPLIPLVALLKLPPKPDPAWRRVRAQVLVMSLIVAGVFGFVVDSGGLGGGTQVKITNTLNPDRGKQAVARLLVVDLTERPVSVLFGLGPAETVSRLSQLTTPSGSKEGSPVQALGLAPSQHYDEYRIAARIPAGQGSSLTSATSSTLGLLGDFGIVGVLCYGWAFLHVARRVWRLGTVLGAVALVGWIAMLLLGGAYDWLEQPPYTLTAAIVVGLALTDPAVRDRRGPRTIDSRHGPVAITMAGPVAGSTMRAPNGTVVSRFLGIPYAAPPVGDLRWRAPRPPRPWAGTRAALEFAPAAPQGVARESRLPGFRPDHITDEDCLALNVWTPGLHGARPVLVWFPGGAYLNGGTAQPVYDASRLAAEANAVVVTVGYRLGALGFLDPEGDGVANCGLRDQLAALDWIRDHATAFGGNPMKVTIMGESAGAGSVLHLLASPRVEAAPTFQRAIVQSGQPSTLTEAQARAVADAFARHLGIDRADADTLRAIPVDRLLEAQAATSAEMLAAVGPMAFAPVIDDDVCDGTIVDAMARGRATDIDLVIGTTRDELALFATSDGIGFDDARLLRRLGRLLGDTRDAERALADYRQRLPATATNTEIWNAATTDVMMRAPALRVADAHAIAGGRTFVYRFDWTAPGLGAAHGVDLPFTFGTADREGWDTVVGWDRRAEALGREWRACWSFFAATGDPSTPLRQWPRHDPAEPAVMVFAPGGTRVVAGLDASLTRS